MMSQKNLTTILLLISMNVLAQDSGITIPFKLFNNHIYIRGFLNDSLPVWILLDCGSGSIVNDEQSKKGKMKTHSPGQAEGVGNNTVPYQLTDSIRFTLGSLRYTEKRVPVLALTEIAKCAATVTVDKDGKLKLLKTTKGNFQHMDAILGDKFFEKFVVRIDFQKQALTLYEPSTFHYSGKGEKIPLQHFENHIYARASIKQTDSLSVSGYFMVDCGSVTGLNLNTPFIKQHKLTPSPEATELSVCGIGGSSQTIMSTVPEFLIGSRRIKKPVALFSQATGGVLTRPDVAGSIGNGILRNFRVILDYSRKEMILE